jgi:hypothetical protein
MCSHCLFPACWQLATRLLSSTDLLRPDSTGAFSRRNSKYFACFFWIVSNQVEIIYSSGRNSKETGEIFRISLTKSARGFRPYSRFSTSEFLRAKRIFYCLNWKELIKNLISSSRELIIQKIRANKFASGKPALVALLLIQVLFKLEQIYRVYKKNATSEFPKKSTLF